MEKVLRKVKCSIQLPKIAGDYDTDIGTLCFVKDKDSFYNNLNNEKEFPEYWYEEVCIDELEEYKMLMKSNLHLREMNAKLQEDDTKEANNRYEKACNSSNNLIQYNHVSEYYYLLWYDVHKVLKIAAGLEEN